MATTVGQLAFVKLGEQFREPRWREGLVTSSEGNWVQVLIRADRADEIEEGGCSLQFSQQALFPVLMSTSEVESGLQFVGALPGRANRRSDVGSTRSQELRFRTAICNSIRPTATTWESSGGKVGRFIQRRQCRFSRQSERFAGADEKALARWGYAHRKSKRCSADYGSQPEVSFLGQESGDFREKGTNIRSNEFAEKREGGRGSTETSTSSTGGSIHEEGQQTSPPAEKLKQRIRQFVGRDVSRFSGKQTPGERPCKGRGRLQSWQAAHVQETCQACSPLCEVGGKVLGGKRSPLQIERSRQTNSLGQTEELAENSLHVLGGAGTSVAWQSGKGMSAGGAVSSQHSSSGVGSGLVGGLDDMPSGGSFFEAEVGRRCRRAGTHHSLSQVDGRVGEEHREAESRARFGCGSLGRSPQSPQKAPQENQRGWKRKRFIQRRGLESPAKPRDINSILDELSSSHGSFGRFWRVLQETAFDKSRPRTPLSGGDSACIFPSVLVIPDEPSVAKNARQRARRRGRESSWQWTSMIWALFSFLECGAPFKPQDQLALARRALAVSWTKIHAEYASRLHTQISHFVRLRSNEPLCRGNQKLSEFIDKIRPLNSHYKPDTFNFEALCESAKPVKPERMSLPDTAGIINPLDFLKGKNREIFENFAERVPHDIPPPKPTKALVKVSPDDLPIVYRKLIDSGVATLIPIEMALKDQDGNIVSGGLFAVPHKEATDRIILDRRPQNELEKRVVMAKLPHGSLFTQLIVPKSHSVRASGDDLSNYFYLLRHHESWLGRNTVGKPVKGKHFLDYGCEAERDYILSFKVIAMGDCNAVDLAQETHLQILQDAGCMDPSETVAFKSCLPAKLTWEGLYIDDHIVTQVVPKRKLRKKDQKFRDDEIIEASRKQYQKLGLPVSSKKQFTHLSDFVAWGTAVSSATGRVGTPLVKLKQLCQLIVEVCCIGRVTQKLIQKTVGLLIHPCMHRRICMSLLQDTYTWCDKLKPGLNYQLPSSVREELLWMGLCLPVMHANMRWPVSQRIGASDASSTGGGRAVTYTEPHIAQTLFRFSEHIGEAVRLDWQEGSLAPPSAMHAAPSELEGLMLAHTWTTSHKCKFAHKQHINILELKMVKAELVDLVQKIPTAHRAVLLVDSRVAIGAFCKGRSSSRQLNRILRSMIGWSIAGEKSLHLIWVQSKSNPPDHPSRGIPIPDPTPNDPIIRSTLGQDNPKLQIRKSNREILKATRSDLNETNEGKDGSFEKAAHREKLFVEGQAVKGFPGTKKGVCGDPTHPAQKHWHFKEIFSGKGRLSHVFRRKGKFLVLPEFELIQRGKPSPEHDLLDDKTFCRLCKEAAKPHQIWQLKLIAEKTQGKFVAFDQCEYQLKIPDQQGIMGLAKKGTKILGSLPGIERLERKCSGQHPHVHVIGGVKVKNGWVRRSTLAGAYPTPLCRAYHDVCERLFSTD